MSRLRGYSRYFSPAHLVAGYTLSLALMAPIRVAAADVGTVAGWVGTTAGAPVSGAVVSLFADARRSFVVVSDATGRFNVEIPAGRYTLRALAEGLRSPIRRVTVGAGRKILLNIELAVSAAAALPAATRVGDTSSLRELEWLVRHKKRSVLEDQRHGSGEDAALAPSRASSLEGSGWLLVGRSEGASLLTLGGPLLEGRWSAAATLPRGSDPAWRASANLEVSSGERYAWRAASAYVARERVAAWLVEGRWQPIDNIAATGSVLYADGQDQASGASVDPSATVYLSGLVAGGVRARLRTLGRLSLPGGDPFLSSAEVPPSALGSAVTPWPQRHLRRRDAQIEQAFRAGSVGVHAFVESSRVVSRRPAAIARGGGIVVGTRVAGVLTGSLTYTRGRLSAEERVVRDRDFDEVVTSLEARAPRSGTRLTAHYRVHRIAHDVPSRRFDVQVRQRLPFLNGVAHGRWELLVAVRNLVYESTEPGNLDEVSVARPPVRTIGGLSVTF